MSLARNVNKTPRPTGVFVDFLENFPDISYRMVDYWERQGWIKLTKSGEGSGSRRQPTEPELDALREVINEYREVVKRFTAIQSGEFFAERLKHWEKS